MSTLRKIRKYNKPTRWTRIKIKYKSSLLFQTFEDNKHFHFGKYFLNLFFYAYLCWPLDIYVHFLCTHTTCNYIYILWSYELFPSCNFVNIFKFLRYVFICVYFCMKWLHNIPVLDITTLFKVLWQCKKITSKCSNSKQQSFFYSQISSLE